MKLRRDQRGSTLLESAIVIPIFVAFVLALINIAILLSNHIVVSTAARDATAALGRTGDVAHGEQVAKEVMEQQGHWGKGTVTITPPTRSEPRVHVRTTYDTDVLAPGFGALLGGGVKDSSVT